MSHWDNPLGLRPRAVNFSQDVKAASKAVDRAVDQLYAELQRAYPLGASVNVVHYRGEFPGTVTGWDSSGARVRVRNSRSGKSFAWWAAQVELAEANHG